MKISNIYNTLEDKERIFFDQDLKPIIVENIEKVYYNDRIYDVTVENHIILVKRDGLVTWSGNSLCHISLTIVKESNN